MAEHKRFMCAITMEPDSTMRAHDRHAVNNNGYYKPPVEIFKNEKQRQRQHAAYYNATEERYPVFPCTENIDA